MKSYGKRLSMLLEKSPTSLLEIGLGITDLVGHLFVPRVEQRHAD
jgi:hypothetical protein